MKDTSPEIERLQFELMMKLGPRKRIRNACEMFLAARQSIYNSLPSGMSEKEKLSAYFQKMYGYPLPADFFERTK